LGGPKSIGAKTFGHTFASPLNVIPFGPFDYDWAIQTETLPTLEWICLDNNVNISL